MITLAFHGAAETVTGSKYLLDVDGTKVLFDCGLFQGLKELRERNWQRLPFNPGHVKAVVLTHAETSHECDAVSLGDNPLSGLLRRAIAGSFRFSFADFGGPVENQCRLVLTAIDRAAAGRASFERL